MKIRLGLLDANTNYINKLIGYFNIHYSEKIMVYAFSEVEMLERHLNRSKLDVLIADADMLPENFTLPKFTALACFSETPDIKSIRGIRAVCKYQKAELIYREILSIYADLERENECGVNHGNCSVLVFMGAAGGVGTTSVAMACALHMADQGKKVLYLNLEKNGVIEPFLSGEGSATLSDVLYAIKSSSAVKKSIAVADQVSSNLVLKLASMVRRDKSGVFFYEPFSVILDSYELTAGNLEELLKILTRYGDYSCVVVDAESSATNMREILFQFANQVFVISSCERVSVQKLKRLMEEFRILDDTTDSRILARSRIIFNRAGFKSQIDENDYSDVAVAGKIPTSTQFSETRIVEEIAKRDSFQKILQ